MAGKLDSSYYKKYGRNAKFGVKGEQPFMEDRHPVVNEKGSGSKSCKCCDSWIAHWINNSGSNRARCVYKGCNSESQDGAHVKFYDIDKQKWETGSWLVPLCKKHNNPNQTNLFYIDKNCELVREAASNKCFKSEKKATKNTNFLVKVKSKDPKVRCACATSLVHYQNTARSTRVRCAVTPCGAVSTKAVAVKSEDKRTDADKWLVPMCDKHAKSPKALWIERPAKLVTLAKTPACKPASSKR